MVRLLLRKPTQQVFPQCLRAGALHMRAGWQHDSLCMAAQRFLQCPEAFLSLTLISHPGLHWALAAPIILRYHKLQVDGDQFYISGATSVCGKCRLCGAAAAAQVIFSSL